MAAAKGLTSDLLAARDEGLSYAQIGARFGITKQSAHERIKNALKVAQKARPPEVIDIPSFLKPRVAPGHPADAIILAVIQRDGIDAAQDRWPRLTIAELQRIKNAATPPPVITEADIAGVERYLASAAVDTTAAIDRPVTVEVKPRPGPGLNAAFVAEVYNRHGMDAVRRRWPAFDDAALDAAIRVGQRMVAPHTDEPAQPLHVRLWRAVKRLFGRS